MKPEEVQKIFEDVGAIRTGHFELSSGLHSAKYVQCALVLQYPQHAERLGKALAESLQGNQISCVVAPAMGGITIGYEVARALGLRSLWVERDRSGEMALRRGWELTPGERVLVVEDVWTTGGSHRPHRRTLRIERSHAVASSNGNRDLRPCGLPSLPHRQRYR
jgi:orotate phosphoribosyltransferase